MNDFLFWAGFAFIIALGVFLPLWILSAMETGITPL